MHLTYLVVIILFSFVINLGSTFDDIMMRIRKPLFLQIFLSTIPLLYFYVFYMQKVYQYLFFKSEWFSKLHRDVKDIIFILSTAGIILLIHLHILNLFLAVRGQESLCAVGYFRAAFWYFFPPLLCYAIALLYLPNKLLFWPVESEETELLDTAVPLHMQPHKVVKMNDITLASHLLNVWRFSKVLKFICDYFLLLSSKKKMTLKDSIPLWKIVVLEKTEKVTFGYFINGEKWSFLEFNDRILTNPWLVKVSQHCYVNMLYVSEILNRKLRDKKHVDKDTSKDAKMNDDQVVLNSKVRELLDPLMDLEKLDLLLFLTRRMKHNFKEFWKRENMDALDERLLEDTVGSITL